MKIVWAYVALVVLAFLAPALALFWFLGVNAIAFIGFGSLLILIIIHLARLPLESRRPFGSKEGRDLAIKSRLEGFWTMETENAISMKVNSWVMIKVELDGKRSGEGLNYRLEPTPTALGAMLIIILLGYTSFLMPPIAIWLFLSADNFARKSLIPMLDRELPSKKGASDEVRELLVISLSEARHLAIDASRALRSSYHDLILMTFGLLGLIGGVVLFVLMISFGFLTDTYYQMLVPLVLAFVISISLSVLVFYLISRGLRAEVISAKDWVTRLEKALAREQVGWDVLEGEGIVELLLQASSELPHWLQARNRGGYRNPGAWLLFFFVGSFSFSLLMSGFSLLSSGSIDAGLLYLAFGFGAIGVLYLIYRALKKQERAEAFQIKESWENRTKFIESRFEQILEEQ